MDDKQSLQDLVLNLVNQTNKLIEQNNQLIEQNTLIVQINAEQSAQLSEVLAMFEDGEPAPKAKSLDGD
ncbi:MULTISPECIES: hypothetical protein [Acinetobacter]|uniref:hypothetical protein n=1 Tax=Acinetobacter TaxID=469 RepID=UPI0007093D2F|nr:MULTISPECIES: hypothetical protein [Acinetobacter]KRJ70815.1 hypothetical protein APC93_11810 [Acinetobacter pittii]MDA3462722.1 hypothetical protein [Acinetobacter sp. AOR41_HL]